MLNGNSMYFYVFWELIYFYVICIYVIWETTEKRPRFIFLNKYKRLNIAVNFCQFVKKSLVFPTLSLRISWIISGSQTVSTRWKWIFTTRKIETGLCTVKPWWPRWYNYFEIPTERHWESNPGPQNLGGTFDSYSQCTDFKQQDWLWRWNKSRTCCWWGRASCFCW